MSADTLLVLAARSLARGDDPFDGSFLREHNVTLDQCYDLSDQLALGACVLQWITAHPAEGVTALVGGSLLLDEITGQ